MVWLWFLQLFSKLVADLESRYHVVVFGYWIEDATFQKLFSDSFVRISSLQIPCRIIFPNVSQSSQEGNIREFFLGKLQAKACNFITRAPGNFEDFSWAIVFQNTSTKLLLHFIFAMAIDNKISLMFRDQTFTSLLITWWKYGRIPNPMLLIPKSM